MRTILAISILLVLSPATPAQEAPPEHPLNTWVKRTPLEKTPPSPRLGYEGDCVWDSKHKVVLRYGGHNQGGGGEQGSEVWICEPFSARSKSDCHIRSRTSGRPPLGLRRGGR